MSCGVLESDGRVFESVRMNIRTAAEANKQVNFIVSFIGLYSLARYLNHHIQACVFTYPKATNLMINNEIIYKLFHSEKSIAQINS